MTTDVQNQSTSSTLSSSTLADSHDFAHPPAKKKCSSDSRESEIDEAILSSLKSIQERREGRVPQQDEEDLFGQQVASVLRRLPRRARALTKINIQQMLFQAEFSDTGSDPAHESQQLPGTDSLPSSNFYNFGM